MYRTHRNSQRTPQWVEMSVKDFINNIPLEYKDGNYTKPAVREGIKNRVMAGSRGGRPGQWSARKAQLVAMEYRKQAEGTELAEPLANNAPSRSGLSNDGQPLMENQPCGTGACVATCQRRLGRNSHQHREALPTKRS